MVSRRVHARGLGVTLVGHLTCRGGRSRRPYPAKAILGPMRPGSLASARARAPLELDPGRTPSSRPQADLTEVESRSGRER